MTRDQKWAYAQAAALIKEEALRAGEKFKPFNSSHEGYGILLEEVDEMWDAIKTNDLAHARKEAIQVGAMALRYVAEVPGTKEYPLTSKAKQPNLEVDQDFVD